MGQTGGWGGPMTSPFQEKAGGPPVRRPGALVDDLQTSRFGMLGTPSPGAGDEILPDPVCGTAPQAGVPVSTGSRGIHFQVRVKKMFRSGAPAALRWLGRRLSATDPLLSSTSAHPQKARSASATESHPPPPNTERPPAVAPGVSWVFMAWRTSRRFVCADATDKGALQTPPGRTS